MGCSKELHSEGRISQWNGFCLLQLISSSQPGDPAKFILERLLSLPPHYLLAPSLISSSLADYSLGLRISAHLTVSSGSRVQINAADLFSLWAKMTDCYPYGRNLIAKIILCIIEDFEAIE